jgi:hypothetical protein
MQRHHDEVRVLHNLPSFAVVSETVPELSMKCSRYDKIQSLGRKVSVNAFRIHSETIVWGEYTNTEMYVVDNEMH